jgi:Transposase DNA-binding/Transposase Tn5 dimerisation domain
MDPDCLSHDAEVWAAQLAAHAQLPDQRLNRRFAEIAALFALKPLDSIPQACGSDTAAKAVYRFFQNERFTADELLEPVTAITAEACRGLPSVLAIQDTTSVNFSTLDHTTGLGPIGSSGRAQGLYLHTNLAVRSDGVALGLLHQEYWSRPDKPRSNYQNRPIEDKESSKWLHGIAAAEAVIATLPADQRPRLIHVMDREGDIHDVLETIAAAGHGAVIRSTHNRLVDGPIRPAHEAVAAAALLGTKIVDLPARAGQPARRALLELRTVTATLTPSRSHVGQDQRHNITYTLVEAREVGAPDGVAALHWLLWTTEPAATLANVVEVLRIYGLRWRIEDFHLTLKSGCRAESLALERDERLIKALTIYSAVAARIVSLRDRARQEPNASCATLLSEDAWQALWLHFRKKRWTTPQPVPTIRQAVVWIGRLGGHLNRKGDGMPGVRTLWRGWRDLTLLVAGYRLGRVER